MPKALSMAGTLIAVVLLLLFAVDLAAGWPFARASMLMDIGMVISAAIVALLSFFTFIEQSRK